MSSDETVAREAPCPNSVCHHPRVTAVAVLGSLLLLGLASVVLWVAAVRLRYSFYMRRLGEAIPRLGFRRSSLYYFGIVRSVLLTGWWRIRARGRDALRQPARDRPGPVVLCVHGFLMDGTCFWGVRRALERAGRPTRAISMGRPHRPIDAYTPLLRTTLEELRSSDPLAPIDVVTHSMGGLVLRRVLEQSPELGSRLRRIVTLGTPHQGTPISRVLPSGPEVRQMARGSDFLRRLADFRSTAPGAEVTSVGSTLDLVVFPVSGTYLPGARSVTLDGIAHIGLLTEPAAIGSVVALLGE